jgi:hypothetical protein
MRLLLALFIACSMFCAPKKIVQGTDIDFQGIVIDTIDTPKEKTHE